uniref:PDZ domain-containing protein n=1 Tax=Brugia timori TaxID=42155 RepID=A0A0R3QQ87_9BILA
LLCRIILETKQFVLPGISIVTTTIAPFSIRGSETSENRNRMEIQRHSELGNDSNEMPSPGGFNLRLTVPKKHYSVQRNDSLQFIITPVFDKAMMQKKTPSSPGTVLTVAGLFVVGITLVLSGVIVLCQQSEQPFRICGSLFIGFGVSMLLICALLQRKNIIKFIEDLNQDLYFFSMSDSYMWKLILQSSEEKERHEEVIIETNNEGLGMRVDENLHVIEITKQGPCDGKLLPGDHIIQINNVRDSMNRINEAVKIGDRTVQTVDEAREAIEAAGVSIRIVFDRGLQSTTQDNIPEQYESLFKRREGFTYHYVQINYVKGCKFGLGIKHFQNNVIVSRIDPGSLAAQSLQEKDHIIDINGIKVTDKEVARSLLVRALKKKNFVSMCIERPVSGKAKEWADDAMNASQMQPPSVAMASDVQEIAARQQQKMMEAMDTKKPGIMKKNINKGGGSDHARIVKIAPGERQDVS